MKKIIILLLMITTFMSCTKKVEKKVVEKKDIYISQEEKDFFVDNKVLKSDDKLIELFFNYVNSDYESFMKNSDSILNSDKSLISFWIYKTYYYLYLNYEIKFDEFYDKFKDSENDFIKLDLDLVLDSYQRRYVDLKKKRLFNIAKFKYSGPYRYDIPYDFNNIEKNIDSVLKNKIFLSKDIDFKKGKISIPERFNKYSEDNYGIHHFVTYFSSKDEMVKFYLEGRGALKILIDNKEIFLQNLVPIKRSKMDIKEVTLNKGIHKLEIFTLTYNQAINLFTDKELKTVKKDNMSGVKKIKDLKKEMLNKLFDYKISNDLKNIFAFETIKDLSSYDKAYRYLKRLKYKNFYNDFLNYIYYNNFFSDYKKFGYYRDKVEDSRSDIYLINSLKKNKNFFKANYLVAQKITDPYKKLFKLKLIKSENLFYYSQLIRLYASIGEKDKAIKYLSKVALMKNGKYFIKHRLKNITQKYDLKLLERANDEEKNNILISEIDENASLFNKRWLVKQILDHPYDGRYFYFSHIVELFNKTEFNNIIKVLGDNFPKGKELYLIKKSENIKKILNSDKLSVQYFTAKIIEGNWNKYFYKTECLDVIKNSIVKENAPQTVLLDHDIIIFDKFYHSIALNRTIKRLNNKLGVDKSSILPSQNYLIIKIIDGETLKETNYNFTDISKIIIKNLKPGDYLETITIANYSYPSMFQYKRDVDVLNAKTDIYMPKDINDIVIKGINGIKDIKKSVENDYIKYFYYQNNISPYKTKFYTPNIQFYLPIIVLDKKRDIKREYRKLQNRYLNNMKYSEFTQNYFDSFKDIKTEKDFKELISSILKKHTNGNAPIDFISHGKSGDLFYFLNALLNYKNIKSEILFVHTKKNFYNKDNASLYYLNKLLKVTLNKKLYYLDLAESFTNFKLPIKYNNSEYLKITSNGDIIKNNFPKGDQPTDIFNVKIKLLDSKNVQVDAVMRYPYQNKAREQILNLTQKQIDEIFYSFIRRKFGYITDFKVELKNLKNRVEDLELIISFKKEVLLKDNKIELKELFTNWKLSSRALFKNYTISEKRDIPLNLNYFYAKTKVELYAPNYKLLNLKDVNIKSEFGEYYRQINKNSKGYKIIIDYKINEMIVPIKNYNKVRDFSQKLDKELKKDYSFKKKENKTK